MTLRLICTFLFSVPVLPATSVLGGPLPGLQSSVSRDGVTISLRKHVFVPDIQQSTLYSLPVAYWTFATQIGSQALELSLDTGMSVTILVTDGVHADGVRYYDPKQSPSSRDAGRLTCGWKMPPLPYLDSRRYAHEYMYGNETIDVKGAWATDEFFFAEGPHIASVTPFILAHLSDDVSRQFMAGGALGLALGIDGSKSAVQHILSGFEKKEVTLWFGDHTESSNKDEGAITFGGRDDYHCDTFWVEMSGDWMVRLTDVAVGPTPLLSSPQHDVVVVGARVSISTPFLEVPWLEYVELVATLRYFANVTDFGESGMKLVNCADVTSLPAIGLHMGDVSVIVTAQEYTTASKHEPNACVILIKLAPPGAWTLGLPFLPKGCISYDYDNAVLGFAKPANR